jgi:hypothetical protein
VWPSASEGGVGRFSDSFPPTSPTRSTSLDPAQDEQMQIFWSLTAIVSLIAIMFIVTRV